MHIILIRHAESDHSLRWGSDAARPLSDIGKRQQKRAASKMFQLGVDFDEAWVSPFFRAKQTLQIIQSVRASAAPQKELFDLEVHGDPQKVYDKLSQEFEVNPVKRLLLVGHNPNISKLLHLLVKDINRRMNTSEVAWLVWYNSGIYLEKYLDKETLLS
jgi:phosphohistidine phosphatase SixA